MTNQPTPTEEQADILEHFRQGEGNLVVLARAGSGKSWTIFQGVEIAPEKQILVAAFNKRIAQHAAVKIQNPAVEVKTLHSLGFKFVRYNWEGVKLNGDRGLKLARQVCGDKCPDPVARAVAKLASAAKGIAPFASKPGDLIDIAVQFDCIPDEYQATCIHCSQSDGLHDDDDEGCQFQGYDLDYVEACALAAMVCATERDDENEIDFDDMIFVPVRLGWCRAWYGLVCIDEAQDMNTAQLYMAQKACKSGGRIVVIGDDRQAIYGFRGADSGSIARLKTELCAKQLTLTATFRCDYAIVTEAQRYVPDIVGHDSVGVGTVRTMARSGLLDAARVGDFVLSRKNAPLATICLALLRAGTRARIEGKDIGASLCSLVRRLAKGTGNTMKGLLEKLDIWEKRELDRAKKIKSESTREDRIDAIADKAAMLREMSAGLQSAAAMIERIRKLFEDDGRPSVVCSTIHKAKGLEAERVFILMDSFDPRRSGNIEEQNLRYVAVTRAKHELVYVTGSMRGEE